MGFLCLCALVIDGHHKATTRNCVPCVKDVLLGASLSGILRNCV